MLRVYRIGEWLAARVPPRLAYAIARVVGAALVLHPRVRRTLRDHQRRLLPGAPAATWRRNARRVCATVTMNYYDLLRLPHLTPDAVRRRSTFGGREHFEAAMARGKGVIGIAPHLGNFNYVPAFTATLGCKVVAVVEQLPDPALHDYIAHLRRHPGLEVIPNGPQSLRTILRTLKENGIVLMLCDRDVGGVTDEVTFFGARTHLPAGPGLIARRTGAAVLPAYAYRTGHTASTIVAMPVLTLPEASGTPEERRAADTQAIARIMEQAILCAPDQWAVLQPVWPA